MDFRSCSDFSAIGKCGTVAGTLETRSLYLTPPPHLIEPRTPSAHSAPHLQSQPIAEVEENAGTKAESEVEAQPKVEADEKVTLAHSVTAASALTDATKGLSSPNLGDASSSVLSSALPSNPLGMESTYGDSRLWRQCKQFIRNLHLEPTPMFF